MNNSFIRVFTQGYGNKTKAKMYRISSRMENKNIK